MKYIPKNNKGFWDNTLEWFDGLTDEEFNSFIEDVNVIWRKNYGKDFFTRITPTTGDLQ